MTLSRRALLRNFSLSAGALALSPVLRPVLAQVEAQAAGAAGGAKRFLFVVEGNGLPWAQVTPPEVKRGKEQDRTHFIDLPMKDLTLPPALEPVAEWKDRLTVVNGLSGKVCGGGHSNNFGALGCFNADGGVGNSGSPRGETIDVA